MPQHQQRPGNSPSSQPSSNWREVIMRRDDLDGLPRFDLPAGFVLRAYQAGDEEAWAQIHRRADAFNRFTRETFRDVFGHDEAALRARQKYLLGPDGQPIGTATAWADSLDAPNQVAPPEPEGRVHWVAIVPEFQGRGLAKPLLAAALWTLRDLGHTSAVLSTDDRRGAAMALYESFGFQVVPN